MCYDPKARVPRPSIIGRATRLGGQRVTLEAADGNHFAAYTARHLNPGGPGVVILPDVRGLHPFYTELALRFAEASVHATAIDYFGRTAGAAERDDEFEFMPHVQRTTPDGIAADVAAAVAHLRSPDGASATSVFTVGFCFGGRVSFNQAEREHSLAGVVGFYGPVAPGDEDDRTPPILLAANYRCSLLGLFGGNDKVIPKQTVEQFRLALEEADVRHHIEIYPGAPHSFFDRRLEEHSAASTDAWDRVLSYVRTGDPSASSPQPT